MTLTEAARLLSECGIEDARGEARLLFELVGKIPRHELIGREVECERVELVDAIYRRCKREPLQYIVGSVGFYNESYEVSPDCLIPRADTELLVEVAVKNLPRGARFLDLCTGSGCVAISTLKNTEDTVCEAFDISDAALAMAKKNAEKNGVAERLTLKRADLTKGFDADERPFAILSNPPYVSDSAYERLEPEIAFEPKIAFVGGEDGADFYRILTPACKNAIDPDGFFAFEIGYDQADILRRIADEHSLSVEILTDLSGLDRVALFRLKNQQ